MAYFVYLAKCSDGSLYCGIAKDVEKRILVHNAGKGAKYTRPRRPVVLVYVEEAESRSAALRREIKIKKMPRTRKLALAARWRKP